MPGAMERSTLYVEGRDDQHSLIELLIRHGIDYDSKPWPDEFPEFKTPGEAAGVGGVKAMLEYMPTAVQLGTDRASGFVLDADSPLASRWQAVRDRLQEVDVEVPDQCPMEGFVGESAKSKSRVGVWLMPDNQHDGTLETFLRGLISEEDPLTRHAESATDSATQLGARFARADRLKAVVHAWLAWQEKPGLPYGTAIRARYFTHDHHVVARFVEWFKRLYGIA